MYFGRQVLNENGHMQRLVAECDSLCLLAVCWVFASTLHSCLHWHVFG